jgi:phosphoglycerate dehydrogenase-like enzyme
VTRIAILDDYQGVALSLADWSGFEVEAFRDHLAGEDAVAERLADFDVVVAMRERTPFPRTLLERLPRLRLLVTTGMRNASIDLAAAREHGIVVSGTGGSGTTTAELTWGLVLAVTRGIPAEVAAVRSGGWQVGLGTGLHGGTLGILGLGRIGGQVARFGNAFGMRVIAWSENLTAERARECGAELVARQTLLAEADVLTIHLVLGDRSRGLVGAPELAQMKPTAFLVNTSRGPIVQETALVEALEAGTIAGAALDVFDEEPLPAEHPLRRLPNVVATPHIGYVTAGSYRIFYGEAAEDVRAFLAGQPVRIVTDALPA